MGTLLVALSCQPELPAAFSRSWFPLEFVTLQELLQGVRFIRSQCASCCQGGFLEGLLKFCWKLAFEAKFGIIFEAISGFTQSLLFGREARK